MLETLSSADLAHHADKTDKWLVESEVVVEDPAVCPKWPVKIVNKRVFSILHHFILLKNMA